MQFLLDHITAVLVGGAVLLLVLLTQRDASGLSIEQQVRYGARMQAQSFTGWFESDLVRVGEGLREGEGGFVLPVQRTDGNTGEFVTFRDTLALRVGAPADTLRLFTRYALVGAGSARVGSTTRPLFALERAEQARPVRNGVASPDPGAWRRGGASPALLSFFRIEAVGALERPAASPQAASYLRARLSLVPPATARAAALPELHWGTTVGLRPF